MSKSKSANGKNTPSFDIRDRGTLARVEVNERRDWEKTFMFASPSTRPQTVSWRGARDREVVELKGQ